MSALLSVRLTPRAKQTKITGWKNDVLHVRVHAPPVDGAANKVLLHLLADVLDVPPSSLRITSGDTHRNKTILTPLPQLALETRIQDYLVLMSS